MGDMLDKSHEQKLDDLVHQLIPVADRLVPLNTTPSSPTCALYQTSLSVFEQDKWNDALLGSCDSKFELLCSKALPQPDEEYQSIQFYCHCEKRHGTSELRYEVQSFPCFPREVTSEQDLHRTWMGLFHWDKKPLILQVRSSSVASARLIEKIIRQSATKCGMTRIRSSKSENSGMLEYSTIAVGKNESGLICASELRGPEVNAMTATYQNGSETTSRLAASTTIQVKHCHELIAGDESKGIQMLPRQTFEIRIQLLDVPQRPSSGSAYICSVMPGSEVIHESHPQGRLNVSLVNIFNAGLPIHSICLSFNCQKDARAFATMVVKMQQKMHDFCAQGPLASEVLVYSREVNSRLSVMVVQGDSNCRIILGNLPSTDSLYLEFPFDSSTLLQLDIEASVSRSTIHLLTGCEGSGFQKISRIRPAQVRSYLVSPPPTENGVFLKSGSRNVSDDWLDDVDRLITVMKATQEQRRKYRPVRVAIIDTGFCPDYHGLNLAEWKDFIDGNPNMYDKTGHGTFSAELIANMCQESELYIARAFDTNNTDDERGPTLMSQAINWAIEPRRKVDIISISAGFKNYSSVLEQAIDNASSSGVLVFAAASNWGNRGGNVAYPARHSFKTICIFSTNTLDQASSFNPEPRGHTDNFAILGEELKHPLDPTKRESGTSMATAISAGLAARIIDFSRHDDNSTIERVAKVGSIAGITAIFRAISKGAGHFQCLSPLKLMPERHDLKTKSECRAYVRESINRAMERAD